MQCVVFIEHCRVRSMQCAVCNVQCAVCSVQYDCAVFCVQCLVCSVQMTLILNTIYFVSNYHHIIPPSNAVVAKRERNEMRSNLPMVLAVSELFSCLKARRSMPC